jgi:hypothetical protein
MIPFARRMDATWRVLRDEVPHLERPPSEYLRDHFWLTTQPIDEPTNPKWLRRVIGQLEDFGMADRILYSSDYPHWDFDNPEAVFTPRDTTPEQRRAIMGGNASTLWGIRL